MKNLESKRIIITGGSLGIGFHIAKACVEQGATVIIVARNKVNKNFLYIKYMYICGVSHLLSCLNRWCCC